MEFVFVTTETTRHTFECKNGQNQELLSLFSLCHTMLSLPVCSISSLFCHTVLHVDFMNSMKSTCYPCWFHWRTFCAIDFIPVLWSIGIFYRLLGFIMFYRIPSLCILASFVLFHSTFSPLMFCSTCLFHSPLFHCNNYSSIFLFNFSYFIFRSVQFGSVHFSAVCNLAYSALFHWLSLIH